MATILDVGVLNHFVPIFVFILVFVVFYAVLLKTNILGDNKGLIALASFVVAFLFLVTRTASEFVQLVTPWFVVLIIVAMCFLLIFMFLGVKPESIASAISQESTVWMILIFLLVLLGIALTKVLGPSIAAITQGEGTEAGFMGSVGTIMFHPKILGAVLILLIASYAIRAVSK
jgi:asparagine N-glycosylation enzyme membrane subunit Stt3